MEGDMDMDPSLLAMLANLLLLQTSPSSPSLPSSSSSSTSTSTSTSSSAPLLLFALAAALSSSSLPFPSPPSHSLPLSTSTSFSTLSSLLSLPPPLRTTRCRHLFGLPFPTFSSLHSLLSPFSASLPLPPHLSIPLTLSRLSRSVSLPSLSSSSSLPTPLISRAVNSTTRLLATALYADVVKPMGHDDAAAAFHDASGLPNLCGAIVSSPVRLRLPEGADAAGAGGKFAHFFSPTRPFPSVLLQAVADARRVFWDACVLAPGAVDPASHFRASSLSRRLAAVPPRESAVVVRGQHVRPYLAGDASFPLLPFLLTPFSPSHSTNPSRNPAHEAFDAALARARAASAEPAVALLKGRWKILRSLDMRPDHAAQTVVACVVLHNMCQLAGEPEDEGRYYWRDPPETAPPQQARPLESERTLYYAGETVRQALADDLYERQHQHHQARRAR